MGQVPVLVGYAPQAAEVQDRKVRLHLRGNDGSEREVLTEHIIVATGYRVDLNRLPFLTAEFRWKIKAVNGTPVLSSAFESSIPGLYFVGIAAANSFGPVMRFAYGAGFAARSLARTMLKSIPRDSISIPAALISGKEEVRSLEEPALRA